MVMQLENSQISLSEERPYLKGIARQLKCICDRLERIERYVNKDNAICLKIQEALADEDSWIVWGKVVDLQNNGVEGLTICLYDRDRSVKDDHLGTVLTNEVGEFCIVYTTSQFQEWFEGNRPDLYLIGEEASGNRVFLCDDSIRWQADRLERFYIRLHERSTGPA